MREFPNGSSSPYFFAMEEYSIFRSTSLQECRNSMQSKEVFSQNFRVKDQNLNGCHGSSGAPPGRPLRSSSECTFDVLTSVLSLMPNLLHFILLVYVLYCLCLSDNDTLIVLNFIGRVRKVDSIQLALEQCVKVRHQSDLVSPPHPTLQSPPIVQTHIHIPIIYPSLLFHSFPHLFLYKQQVFNKYTSE